MDQTADQPAGKPSRKPAAKTTEKPATQAADKTATKPKAPAKKKESSPAKAVKAAVPDQPAAAPSHADVANLAHSLWVERGHQHGHDAEDWIRAEQILHVRSNVRSSS